MTPMIDVIFLLIIFFLCVNQYQKADSAQEVLLPEASSDEVQSPESTENPPLVLNVLPDEGLFIAGQKIATEQLAPILRRAQKDLPTLASGQKLPLEVWIRADRKLPYKVVEPLLQIFASEGIWKVSFKVQTPEQAQKKGQS